MRRSSSPRTTRPSLALDLILGMPFLVGLWLLMASCTFDAFAQPPGLGAPQMLPGDDQRQPAVERQTQPDIAEGANGYLVVWTEERSSSLTGFSLTDVYAARLSPSGALLDPEPILVSTADHKQTGARVAWGGSSWLVVFRTQRATQFFLEEDIVGVRVGPDGSLLDNVPLVIAASMGSSGGDPEVAGDGSGWGVVWPLFNDAGVRGVQGARVSSDGVVLDPDGRPLWYDASNTYAFDPRLAWNGTHYLLAWNKSGLNLYGLRLDAALQPVEAQPFQISVGGDSEVAAGGGDFYVVWVYALNVNQEEARGTRISAAGQVLDPGGVTLSSQLFVSDLSPSVAWNGAGWTTAFADDGTGSGTFDFDLNLRHVGTDGVPVEPAPVPVDAGNSYATQPQLAPPVVGGEGQLVWQRRPPGGFVEDIAAVALPFTSNAGNSNLGTEGTAPRVDISIGLPRQLSPELSQGGPDGSRLLVFTSQVSGSTRILGQRIGPTGSILDPEPVALFTGPEFQITRPRAAWNGSVWLLVWQGDEGIFSRRFDADLAPLDAQENLLLPFFEDPAVAALDGVFLVAACEPQAFHEPQRWLSYLRMDGAGTVLDPEPVLTSPGFEIAPRAMAVGNRWLLVWESQVRHDRSASSIDLAWIGAGGVVESVQPGIDGDGYGDDPDVAVSAAGAFLVWHDNVDFGNAEIEGRTLATDGTLGPVQVLVTAAREQVAPRIDRFEDGWLVSWLDTRALEDLAEARPDLWAARLAADGTVFDPGGFPVAVGPLAELTPEVAGLDSTTLLLYAAQVPEAPAGHRLIQRAFLTPAEGEPIFTNGFEDGSVAGWSAVVGVSGP